MATNCASCAGDWAFDPTKPRKEHKDCDWLHGAGAGADVPLNDSATAYLASCDALRTESDAGVLTCLLTRDDVLRPTRNFGDGGMLPLARALARVSHVVALDLSGVKSPSGANWKLLGVALRQMASTERLLLRRCGMRGVDLENVLSGGLLMAPKSAVAELVLSDNPLGHDVAGGYSTGKLAARELTRLCGEAKRFGPLAKLDVSRCLLPPEAVVAVRAAAEAAGVRHPIGGNCPREELLNGLTHGLGIIFAFFGGLMMMRRANATNDMATVLGCGVFCIAMNALYLISTLYHSLHKFNRVGSVFAALDHAAIYVLIAGTYTPFVTITLRSSATAFWILAAEWAATCNGVYLCVYTPLWSEANQRRVKTFELVLYVAMGWLVTIVKDDLAAALDPRGVRLVVYGGLFYTGGIVFFSTANTCETRYVLHALWHLCVLAATICHFFAIFYYVLPEVPLSPHVDSLGVLVGPAPYATAPRLPGQA